VSGHNATTLGMSLTGTAVVNGQSVPFAHWVGAGATVNIATLTDVPTSLTVNGPSTLNGGHGFSCQLNVSDSAIRATVNVVHQSGVYSCAITQKLPIGDHCPTPGHPCP
jgi:hypothetical protein